MARATIADLCALGLPQATLTAVPSVLTPPVHAGAGAGTVAPGGTLNLAALLVGVLNVVARVVAGGLPGVATWQWSTDGGVTYAAAVPTPAAGVPAPVATTAPGVMPPPGLATGLTAAFAGLLNAGDTYAWTATSNAQRALDAAADRIDAYLDEVVVLPLAAPYPLDLVEAECALAAWKVLVQRGLNPDNPGDKAVRDNATAAIKWCEAVRNRDITPKFVAAVAPPSYVVVTQGADRGLYGDDVTEPAT